MDRGDGGMSRLAELQAEAAEFGYKLVNDIPDTVNDWPGRMHIQAAFMSTCIGDGEVLSDKSAYHLKAVIAICEAALEGKALKGGDVHERAVG